MGHPQKAERATRRSGQAFRADLLALADVFPEPGMEPGHLMAAACGPGLTLRQEGRGLLLTCIYETAWGAPVMRGRDLAYAQVLDLIRAGGLVPAQLELVLAPAGATGAWSLDQSERVTFSYGEWWLAGWEHRSENRIARGHERLRQLGMEIETGPPFLKVRFHLAPKVPHVERKRLLAARAAFDRVSSAGRRAVRGGLVPGDSE